MTQNIKNDYSKWIPNIKVVIWGNPTKLEKPDNCPEPDKHNRCIDDKEDCPYFMGHAVTSQAYWGDELRACCGKLLIQEVNNAKNSKDK